MYCANVLKERLGDKAKKVPTRKLPDWLVRIVGLFESEVRRQLPPNSFVTPSSAGGSARVAFGCILLHFSALFGKRRFAARAHEKTLISEGFSPISWLF